MSQLIYCNEAKCIIEAPDHPDDLSIDSTEYTLSAIADRFSVPNILGNTVDIPKIQFDLPHQFSIDASIDRTDIVGDDNRSSCTWRTNVLEETFIAIPPVQQNRNKSNKMSLVNHSKSGKHPPIIK